MQELEKILEEIEEATRQEDAPIYCGDMEIDGYVLKCVVEDIIRKHLSRESGSEITRSSRDSICGECRRRKWYLKGYEDGKNDGWIPVDEKLPGEEGYYLIISREKGREDMPKVSYYSKKKGWIIIGSKVIAWRDLPDPYRPERTRP